MAEWTKEKIIDEFILEFDLDEETEPEQIDEIWNSLVILNNTAEFSYQGKDYLVFLDEDALIKYAEDYVADLLKESPETFSEDFLRDYIEVFSEADASMTAADFAEMEREYIRKEVEEEYADKIEELEKELEKLKEGEESAVEREVMRRLEKEYKSIEEELDEINDEIDREVDRRIEKIEKEFRDALIRDPVDFLEDRGFSFEEILEFPFIKIDIERAAEEAVSMDGWEHFIGDLVNETRGGLYYIQT